MVSTPLAYPILQIGSGTGTGTPPRLLLKAAKTWQTHQIKNKCRHYHQEPSQQIHQTQRKTLCDHKRKIRTTHKLFLCENNYRVEQIREQRSERREPPRFSALPTHFRCNYARLLDEAA